MSQLLSPRNITIAGVVVAGLILATILIGCAEPTIAQSIERSQRDVDAGRGAQAVKRLERTFAKNPDNTSVIEALAFAHLNAGDAARAGDLFNQLGLTQTPDDHLYAAQAFKKANQPDKAIEAYRLYLLNEPKQATPWNELGELLIATGKTDEGISALVKANEISPSAELCVRIAGLYREQNNSSQTERYMQSALRLAKAGRPAGSTASQTEEDILSQLTQMALDQKKPMEAERHLRQLERDFPENKKVSDLKDRLVRTKKTTPYDRKPEPERKVSKTSTIDALPILPSPAPKPKADPLVDALSDDNQNADRWVTLAASKAKAGDYVWAETAYLEAMRLNPGKGPIITAYLEVLKKRRSPAEYLDEAERQLQKYPEIPELYLVSARGYRDLMQNKRNARVIFNKFLKKFPMHADAAKVKAELEEMK